MSPPASSSRRVISGWRSATATAGSGYLGRAQRSLPKRSRSGARPRASANTPRRLPPNGWPGRARAVTGERPVGSVAPAAEALNDAALPLTGLKVLDLSWVVAGPVIGRALADFGATVVRVESATRVETARHVPPFYGGVPDPRNAALYITWNCGKLGVTADLSTERGREVVRRLADWSDVVLESFSPGQMQRWGLDYASLSADHPDLIMLSTALMGQTGPDARLAGYGNIGAALSGFQNIAGWPDRPPLGPYGAYTDYLGPRFSLTTLLAALDHRQRTGDGCYIDVSQVEAGVFMQSPEMADYARNGAVVHRIGNADRVFAPHGVYRCRTEDDGTERFVAIAVRTDEQWRELTTLMVTSRPRRRLPARRHGWAARPGRRPRLGAGSMDHRAESGRRRTAPPGQRHPRPHLSVEPGLLHRPATGLPRTPGPVARPAARHGHGGGPPLPAICHTRPGEAHRARLRPGQRIRPDRAPGIHPRRSPRPWRLTGYCGEQAREPQAPTG